MKKKPWLAGLLSTVLPGLGHFYIGKPFLGLAWYTSLQLLIVAYGLVSRSPVLPPAINIAGILIPVVGNLLVIFSAIRLAKKTEAATPSSIWNRWYAYLGVFLIFTTLSSVILDVIKDYIVKAYKLPSGAMIPTLLVGDHVFVDKLAYRIGIHPQRGDVIVFKFPEDESKDFIKRIVGMPGDTIEIRDKHVLINGTVSDDASYTQRIDSTVIPSSINSRDNFGPVTVPPDSFFVLGDNRDQSLDSRFWGFVEEQKIKGKATIVYWSWSGTGKWTEWVRWIRIGQKIL